MADGLGGPLEAQKKHQELVARIEKQAKEAFENFPEIPDSMLTEKGKEQIKQTRRLIRAARTASSMPTEKLNELAKALTGFSDRTKQLLSDNKGQDTDTGVDCLKVYDDCINRHNCDESEIFCLCCAPCSLLYARCVAGEILAAKVGHGLFLAPNQELAKD